MFTNEFTVQKTYILVLNVGNGFRLSITWRDIWSSIAINTSAVNVEKAAETMKSWLYTDDFILGRNCLNVVFVANDLQHQAIWRSTAELIAEKNHTNVTCVTGHLVILEISVII